MADKNFKVKSGLNIPITSAAILTTDSSGNISSTSALAIANGGTGQTTATNAINALLPIQSGSTVNYSIQSDGTNISWAKVYNQLIQNAGTSVTPRRNINIVGGTFADDAGTDTTTITFTDNVGVSKSGGDTITASSASVIPLIAKGAASQTANLQEWQNSAGTVLSAITSTGGLSIGRSNTLGAASFTIQGVTPISLYANDNTTALQNRMIYLRGNSTGNVMSIASKGDTANGVAALVITDGGFSNELVGFGYNGNIYANLQSASTVGLTIKAAASQTADLQQWQSSNGTVQSRMTDIGKLFSNYLQSSYGILTGNATYAGGYNFISNPSFATTDVSLIVKAVSSQTSDLQQWQNSAGTVVARVTSAGVIKTDNMVSTNTMGSLRYYWGDVNTGIQSLSYITGSTNAGLVIETIDIGSANATFDSCIPLTIRGLSNQTGDLQRWVNSSNTVLASLSASGNLMVQNLTVNGTTTTINSTTLTVDDKNIELASVASPTDTTANGAGITIKGATDKTFNWVQSTAAFTSSEPISAPAFKSAGTAVSSNITLVSGYKYFVDTTAARTLTLPASPSLGDEIYVFDASNTALTNNITVASNSNKIQGSVQDLIIDSNAATVYLTYTGSTYGWAVS